MATKIKTKKITETKKLIKGILTLSDKTKTHFEIDKKTGEWYQWGNATENLYLSVPFVESLRDNLF